MSYITTKVIVLNQKNDWRDADRSFVMYSDTLGKINGILKGGKKINSKLSGHLAGFNVCEVVLAQAGTNIASNNLWRITGAYAVDSYGEIQKNFKKIILAKFCLESVDIMTKDLYPDEGVYNLLKKMFLNINNIEGSDHFHYMAKIFLWRLFAILGFAPELYKCLVCNNKILPEINVFNFTKGGITCYSCAVKSSNRKQSNIASAQIGENVIKLLRFILNNSMSQCLNLKAKTEDIEKFKEVVGLYSKMRLDRELKSEQLFGLFG